MEGITMKTFSVSQAIESIGVNKFTWFIFFLIGFIIAFDGFDYMLVSYTMPQIEAEWGLTKVQTGSLASWSALGMLFGAGISGLIADKIGRKKVIVGFVLFFSLFTFLIFFVNSYNIYILLRICAGIALGACVPVVSVMMSEFSPAKNRAIFISLNSCFMTGGYVLAGIIATLVIPVWGWRFCYFVGGLPIIYGMSLLYLMPESAHWLASMGRKEEACKVLNRLEKASNSSHPNIWKAENLILPPPPKKVGFKAIFTGKLLRITLTLSFIQFMVFALLYGINAWLPSLLMQKGFTMATAYSITIAQNLVSILSGILCGFGSELFGRQKNAALTFALTAVGVIALALSEGFWPILIGNIFLGFIRSYLIASMEPLLVESYCTEFRTTGVAFCTAIGRSGGIITPLIVGYILQIGYGYVWSLLFFVLPCIIGIILLMTLKYETRGKTFEQIALDLSNSKVN